MIKLHHFQSDKITKSEKVKKQYFRSRKESRMLKLCLTLILLGSTTQINCENLPAFIWGSNTPTYLPALQSVNGDEFATIVKSQTDDDTLTLVFVEPKLSVEDFSTCKLNTQTCFQNLQKESKKTYLPSVENPVEALESSFGKHQQRNIEVTNEKDFATKFNADSKVKILFVYLDSNDDFSKHDELMSKLYHTIASKRENVIAIYTARQPSFVSSKSLVRKARDTAVKQEQNEEPRKQHVIENKNLLLALSGLRIGEKDVDVKTLSVVVNSSAEKTLNVMIKSGSDEIEMLIEESGGTWWAPIVKYNTQRYLAVSPISAPSGWSFGCVDLRFSNGNTYIYILDVQMQPQFGDGPELKAFAPRMNDCTGFFSAAIWGALFVVILLLMIMSCGLTAIMDIRTMDRFDDPKGKTITVSAQE